MSTIPKTPAILDKIVDIVLAHKPKKISKPSKKQKLSSKNPPKKSNKNTQ